MAPSKKNTPENKQVVEDAKIEDILEVINETKSSASNDTNSSPIKRPDTNRDTNLMKEVEKKIKKLLEANQSEIKKKLEANSTAIDNVRSTLTTQGDTKAAEIKKLISEKFLEQQKQIQAGMDFCKENKQSLEAMASWADYISTTAENARDIKAILQNDEQSTASDHQSPTDQMEESEQPKPMLQLQAAPKAQPVIKRLKALAPLGPSPYARPIAALANRQNQFQRFNKPKKCRLCKGDHNTDECTTYSSWLERQNIGYQLGICERCGKHSKDIPCRITNQKCRHCGGPHADVYCPIAHPHAYAA